MDPKELLTWVLALFMGLIGFTVILQIWTGKIDLKLLISEEDGSASMSRFQMLVFTFVVSVSLFLIVISEPTAFPDVPPGVLGLLGISMGTYAVSKGIQKQADQSEASTVKEQKP